MAQTPNIAKLRADNPNADPDIFKLQEAGIFDKPSLEDNVNSVIQTPDVSGTTAPVPITPPQTNSFITPSRTRTNLGKIAGEYNGSFGEFRKLNPQLTDINNITSGTKINLPQGIQANTGEQVIDPKQLAQQANAQSQQIFNEISNKEVTQRNSSNIIRNAIQSVGNNAPQAPQAPSLLNLFTQEKQKLGIEPLQTRLAEINSEIERLQVGSLVDSERSEGRAVSQRQIDLRKNSIGKEAQLQQALLNVEKGALSRQVTNSLEGLKMVMDFTQQDFQNASTTYENEYRKNKDTLDTLFKLEDREIAQEDKLFERQQEAIAQVKLDAQAQLQTVTNMLKESRKTFDDMTEEQIEAVQMWEMQAGYPAGTFETFGASKPDARVLHTSSGVDASGNEIVTFIYEDPENPGRPGVSEIVKTGARDQTATTRNLQNQLLRKEIDALNAPIESQGTGIEAIIANSSSNNSFMTDSQLEKVQQAELALGSLESLRSLMATEDDSFSDSGVVRGKVRSVLSALGQDAEAGAIAAQIQGLIPTVARGIFGEVGVLTDADINNYKKTLPNLTTPEEQNQLVTIIMYDVLSRSLATTLTSNARNGKNVSGFQDTYRNIEQTISNARSDLGVTTFTNDTNDEFIDSVPEFTQASSTDESLSIDLDFRKAFENLINQSTE